MGEEVRVTVIAAGFERWEAGGRTATTHAEPSGGGEARSKVLGADAPREDIFATPTDDLDLGDDDFDVPSFLR
jgi:cell division protein FtsZ